MVMCENVMYEMQCDEVHYGFRRRTRPTPHILIQGPYTANWVMIDHAATEFRIGMDWYKVNWDDEYGDYYAVWVDPQEN